ncbi:PIG-L deacetylase family protein [Streptomyces fructofermentans]|uniref:PIG-L deacetylase family protein n=1 Tax=Streptomyces fructofermentans TaxID=152141 RepID=UPI0037BAB0C7
MPDQTTPLQLQHMPTEWQRALAVVAHPDDLEYGCSSAIASWVAEGREITYVLATRGEAGIDTMTPEHAAPLREAEQRAAADVVGVSAVEFLDHRDGVIEYGPALRRDIAAVVRRHRPELIVTLNHRDDWGPGTWNTPDHVALGRAVLDAASDAGNRWIFPELAERGLRPWDGVRWVAVANSPLATHAVAAEPGFERGVQSLLRHRAYIAALTDEDAETYVRERLRSSTDVHSSRFDGRPAVAFELFTR